MIEEPFTMPPDQQPLESRVGYLHDLISGEWYTRTLPHPPGPYAPKELVPGLGAVTTLRRLIDDEPNLTDRFSGIILVPLYHTLTISAVYGIGRLVARLF